MLNQKPDAMPRPWLGPSGVDQCGWFFAAASVSTKPMALNLGPRLRAFLCRVFLTQRERIHAEFLRQFVEGRLDGERGDRRARGAISGRLRLVDHDVITDAANVFQIVRRKSRHAPQRNR